MPVRVFHTKDWRRRDGWNGGWNGQMGDTNVSFIFADVEEEGFGPKLHSHSYDEVQIIRRGTAIFEVDGQEIVAKEGDILVVAAGSPHKFRTTDERTDIISVQLTGKMEAEWLE